SGQTAATLQRGSVKEFHGSRSLVLCDEAGEVIEPYSVSAGLDYPGIGPLIASLVKGGRAEVYGAADKEALEAAFELTEQEGIIPAIESAHALAVLRLRKFKREEVVVINLSGRGDKDIETYLNFKKK
ncbi:MAG: tryptophan synthase subunit beta, partial [Rikenellaceae bacterium]